MIFNVGGYEILVIAIVALIAVGPEQLPSVMRKVGSTAAQLRGMASGMRDEFMSGMNEVTDLADPDSWLGSGADDDPIVPRGYADRHKGRQGDSKALSSDSTSASDRRPVVGEADEAGTTPQATHQIDGDDEDDDEVHTVVTMPSGELFTPDDDPPAESGETGEAGIGEAGIDGEPEQISTESLGDTAGNSGETAGSNGSRA